MNTALSIVIFFAVAVSVVTALLLYNNTHRSHRNVRIGIVIGVVVASADLLLRHFSWLAQTALGVAAVGAGGAITIAYDSVRARRNQEVTGDGTHH